MKWYPCDNWCTVFSFERLVTSLVVNPGAHCTTLAARNSIKAKERTWQTASVTQELGCHKGTQRQRNVFILKVQDHYRLLTFLLKKYTLFWKHKVPLVLQSQPISTNEGVVRKWEKAERSSQEGHQVTARLLQQWYKPCTSCLRPSLPSQKEPSRSPGSLWHTEGRRDKRKCWLQVQHFLVKRKWNKILCDSTF